MRRKIAECKWKNALSISIADQESKPLNVHRDHVATCLSAKRRPRCFRFPGCVKRKVSNEFNFSLFFRATKSTYLHLRELIFWRLSARVYLNNVECRGRSTISIPLPFSQHRCTPPLTIALLGPRSSSQKPSSSKAALERSPSEVSHASERLFRFALVFSLPSVFDAWDLQFDRCLRASSSALRSALSSSSAST